MNYQELLNKMIEHLEQLPFSKKQCNYFYLLSSQVQFHEISSDNIVNGICQYDIETLDHQNKYRLKNDDRTCFMSFPYIAEKALPPIIQINLEEKEDIDVIITHEIVHLLSSHDEMSDHLLFKRIGVNQYYYQYQEGKIIKHDEEVYDILNEILTEIMTQYLSFKVLHKKATNLSFTTLAYNDFIKKRLNDIQMSFVDLMIAYFSGDIKMIEKILGHRLKDMEMICRKCFQTHQTLSLYLSKEEL